MAEPNYRLPWTYPDGPFACIRDWACYWLVMKLPLAWTWHILPYAGSWGYVEEWAPLESPSPRTTP